MNDTKKPDYYPEWFDLDNYKGLSKISRSKWKFLIDMKSHYFWRLNGEYGENLISCEDEQNADLERFVFSTKAIIENEFSINNEPIQDVRIIDEVRRELYKGDTIEQENIESPPSNCLDFKYQVDTNYSDEAIIEAFKKELTRIRQLEGNNSGATYSDSYIKSLIADNVVPYIDLILWQNKTGDCLTDAQIANLIFPDEYDIDRVNKIRKTVKVKALELLSPNGRKFI